MSDQASRPYWNMPLELERLIRDLEIRSERNPGLTYLQIPGSHIIVDF